MKFALSTVLALSLTVSSATAAKTHKKDQHKLDEMHAAAFGAVVTEHSASDWKMFVSEGPLPPLVQVDPMAGHAEQKKPAKTNKMKKNKKKGGRELWWKPGMPMGMPDPPSWPKVGYYAIDTDEYGAAMEVKNKSTEQCIYINEGIGKDGWSFGITQGPLPDMSGPFDTFLQLFTEDAPVMPMYKAFQGAKQLCIGEKKGNIAYMYIVFGTGCYWLIGHPDAGRDDHLPKLKIRDQDGVIVRFRDGPGDMNALWQIYENGMSRTSPYAKWYFIPNEEPKICPDGYNGLPNTNGPGCTLCVKDDPMCTPVACTLPPSSVCETGDADCCTANPCATPCINALDKNSAQYLQCTQQTCTVGGPPECSKLACPNPINGVVYPVLDGFKYPILDGFVYPVVVSF